MEEVQALCDLFFCVAAGVVCAIGIGVWFLYWGMRCGFDGIDSHMFVDVKTYKRFYSYEHLEDYSYEGLARMYADYKYTDGGRGVMLYTTYPLGSLPLYRFLLYMCILCSFKSFVFAMLGSGIRVLDTAFTGRDCRGGSSNRAYRIQSA